MDTFLVSLNISSIYKFWNGNLHTVISRRTRCVHLMILNGGVLSVKYIVSIDSYSAYGSEMWDSNHGRLISVFRGSQRMAVHTSAIMS